MGGRGKNFENLAVEGQGVCGVARRAEEAGGRRKGYRRRREKGIAGGGIVSLVVVVISMGEGSEIFTTEFCGVLCKLIDLMGKPNISDFFPLLAGLDIQGVKKQAETYMQSDVVSGGTDTTATNIKWAMVELMNNPEVMRKAQKELCDVVGLNNMVEELHIPKLKYLEAVIKETMRLHLPGPLLLPKYPACITVIPKNTTVFINMCLIHRDPLIWDNPMEFKPGRFLDGDIGKCDYRGNHFHYLPFGSGRRICAGIPLEEKMLFYFLASLLHSFDWKNRTGRNT
ncbi:PREDICTED: flavonoid 3',5'-hydroxylase 1-like [Erythranthe guttata]|uniref:flavonoid 3',5'-hydroxylase 1-like n=1 Tax=Erythranthe guttata TaxID=4155 RepID=UPI00064D77D6|nr:PREDICTED: flavonoid 3',5'-hydroxylase 1-like [Erythranthe guttata]|eukprot:XP_012833615.1 PREDICTED: flavonoid 3',5'-hydroxylase 1-like [Erythranthe guttata]